MVVHVLDVANLLRLAHFADRAKISVILHIQSTPLRAGNPLSYHHVPRRLVSAAAPAVSLMARRRRFVPTSAADSSTSDAARVCDCTPGIENQLQPSS